MRGLIGLSVTNVSFPTPISVVFKPNTLVGKMLFIFEASPQVIQVESYWAGLAICPLDCLFN